MSETAGALLDLADAVIAAHHFDDLYLHAVAVQREAVALKQLVRLAGVHELDVISPVRHKRGGYPIRANLEVLPFAP